YILLTFFFSSRRRHTRWPRDWSSDVCSSDLTWRAISPQANTRAARVNAVASSSATTQPSGEGPSDAICTRICRPPTSNSRSAMRSEERRVGKEGGGGGAAERQKQKKEV